ncbi:MAG: addiction module protein [Spirochaetes bacterium]|nr:addiction module protein [Spirochaetota bacterium]
MRTSIKKIRENALALSSSERANLIHDLILSLEDESSFDLAPEYETEIQKRVKSVKNGKAIGSSIESVSIEIEQKFS